MLSFEDLASEITVAHEELGDAAQALAIPMDREVIHVIPKEFVIVGELPRNAMGKVTKPAVRALFDPDESA